MQSYLKSVLEWEYLPHLVASGVVLVITVPLVKRVLFKRRIDLSRYPRDKVTLCQIPRGPWAPSLSPFPLKLETYLRMAKIPYQNEFGSTMSSKGKTPWMVYDGQEMADSQLCIEHLNQARGIDLNSWLTDEQRAIARAFQIMIEDHLYWPLALHRWVYTSSEPAGRDFLEKEIPGLNRMMIRFVKGFITKQAHGQGMGRHTRAEVESIGKADVRALSTFLGDKPFLMGSEPCEVDCAIFGFLAQMYWHFPNSFYEQLVKGECSNLGAYCERMKEKFWPDWDECITHGGKQEATK